MDKDEIEKLCRKLIKEYDEYPKVDFKTLINLSKKEDKISFCKKISAIANTNIDEFENKGYLIIGAEKGKLIGEVKNLGKDSTSSSMHQIVNSYLEPNLKFQLRCFEDKDKGLWGVIEIPDDPKKRPINFQGVLKSLRYRKAMLLFEMGILPELQRQLKSKR